MADIFNIAVDAVLASEGGYSNDPPDPETNLGITIDTLAEARERRIVPRNTTLRTLTAEHAKTIYRVLYWDAVSADKLPRALAFVVFDAAVNQGVPTAIMLLQKAVKVKVDGVIGPVTLKAAARRGADARDTLLALRAERYADLVTARPHMLKYRHGWLKRCFCVARLAVEIEAT